MNDLNTAKAKKPKKFRCGFIGFIRNNDNSDFASKITKSSFVPTTEEFRFCMFYIILALLHLLSFSH